MLKLKLLDWVAAATWEKIDFLLSYSSLLCFCQNFFFVCSFDKGATVWKKLFFWFVFMFWCFYSSYLPVHLNSDEAVLLLKQKNLARFIFLLFFSRQSVTTTHKRLMLKLFHLVQRNINFQNYKRLFL